MANERGNEADSRNEGTASSSSTDRRHFETIVQVLPDPVYALDADGYLTFTNRAFDEQFGFGDRATTEGLHFSEITTDDGAETVREHLRELIGETEEQSRGFTLAGTTADGRTLELEGSIGVLPHSGSFEGAAGVMRDVTADRRQEEVFTVMDRALRHNLRTTVNLIDAHADLLEPEISEGHAEHLQTIRESANWLLKLGETLRTLRTAIDESLDTGPSRSIESVVGSAVEANRAAYEDAIIEANLTAVGQLDAGSPIERALEEVIENAIVHNDRDQPEVTIWVTHAQRDGWIEILVEDNGPGMPEFEREIILGEAEITQLQHGSGIGLWITRWVVQVFDGEVDIDANEPRGTVVTLRLPLADPSGDPEE